ncbi:type IV toxin-antitoxin system AbiEi family antitoxin domain-containing protein [Cellulomonas sp. ACRRI]|uniref:type IV toxin-antitoxin system AbiEi family antitoxin domain-containing protein n=1 Tax=Cellulomonas sp. ACRRI TaxID=2918188 RepID=UPI001EF1CC5A|nr:type IV toxin-antitoxin system AbiEi family antitoxin domain-containing protein [Cellulomonas sp. ACRRI]MCG7285130.1 type IV toxin-antitoxin system AbiEi family antitoxin domain-containing protein [Cellulomonas sp. ACRRI]
MDDQLDLLPPGAFLARDAARAGVDDGALRRAVRAGLLVRPRTGVYVRADQWGGAGPEARHLLVVQAVARQLDHPVFSHESAAVLWGLPPVGTADAVHVLGPVTSTGAHRGTGTRAGLVRHAARAGVPITSRSGLRVTAAAETLVSLARARDLVRAVPVVDHALRAGLATREDLWAALADHAGGPGARRAALAVSLGDGASESVGESVSRVRIHLDGLEPPALQVRLAHRGDVVARVDFWWEAARVVGEFDGRKKYRVDGVPDGRAVEDRVWAEKQREDRLRDLGVRVVRWTWSDVRAPGVLARRLVAAGIRPTLSGAACADRRRVGRKA